MAEYLGKTGLKLYDEKIKEYVTGKVADRVAKSDVTSEIVVNPTKVAEASVSASEITFTNSSDSAVSVVAVDADASNESFCYFGVYNSNGNLVDGTNASSATTGDELFSVLDDKFVEGKRSAALTVPAGGSAKAFASSSLVSIYTYSYDEDAIPDSKAVVDYVSEQLLSVAVDHPTAQADHIQASSDHGRAESDHSQAVQDHAAVEVYVDSLGAFDISSYHATGGVLAKYADLAAAIGTNGANIPEGIRKGGMSVKFVQSSDNKYVQYRLMADTFSTTESDWQGVDDEPTQGSDNLVKSDGVWEGIYESISQFYSIPVSLTKADADIRFNGYLNQSTQKYQSSGPNYSLFYKVSKGDRIHIKANSDRQARYGFTIFEWPYNGHTIHYAMGDAIVYLPAGKDAYIEAPATCYLYVHESVTAGSTFPAELTISHILPNTIKDALYSQCSFSRCEQKTIIPAASDTYNALWRSSLTENVQITGNSQYKRLTYVLPYIVKGGEKLSITTTGVEAINIWELPYIPLNKPAIQAVETASAINHAMVMEGDARTETITLQPSTKIVWFIVGAIKNEVIEPQQITSFITSISAPIADIESIDVGSAVLKPSGMTMNFKYSGNRIFLSQHQEGGFIARSTANWGAIGTSCNYGKYAVGISKGEGTFYIYNLDTLAKLATFTQTAKDSSIFHANCATFVAQRYDENDFFPLLYVSVRIGADDTNHPNQPSINVYRILPTFTDGEISSFTATQVQTIWLPAQTESNGHGSPNIMYDAERNCLWAIGRQNEVTAPYYLQARLFQYDMPSTLDAVVSITTLKKNVLLSTSALNMQGGVVIGENIFIGRGYSSVGYIDMVVVNILTGEVTNVIDLFSQGVTWEPEGTLYYNTHVWLQDSVGRLYEFYL